jgi:hypothetical protein
MADFTISSFSNSLVVGGGLRFLRLVACCGGGKVGWIAVFQGMLPRGNMHILLSTAAAVVGELFADGGVEFGEDEASDVPMALACPV